uniref:Uncharacterized protein n=1 Tax=Avena sativa TaxID=4498 RepID=A0ACD6ADH6_AVESA
MSELQGWADLPDDLLHSVIALLCSFHDLLAFAATSQSWRAAFSSYPCKHTFSALFPPLLLQPDIPWCSPCPNPVPKRLCHVSDLANKVTYRCSQIPHFARMNTPPGPLDGFFFRGSSYGHLILSSESSCLLVDAFTGVTVSPPQLPAGHGTHICYGALTAPLASPNSHLILSTEVHNLFWRVGDRSWLTRSRHRGALLQIVVFEGKVYGMDFERNIFVVHLSPWVYIQRIAVSLRGAVVRWRLAIAWLVPCTDMLLLVGCEGSLVRAGHTFKVFRLDLSTEPSAWVKVDSLHNRAIFLSTNERSQPLCCMNPERWGGRSNCIYCYVEDCKNWITLDLRQPPKGNAFSPNGFMLTCRSTTLTPMWVVPSMFSSCL